MSGEPLKVHVTGVYGLIGNLVYKHLSTKDNLYDVYGSGRRTISSDRADADSLLQSTFLSIQAGRPVRCRSDRARRRRDGGSDPHWCRT